MTRLLSLALPCMLILASACADTDEPTTATPGDASQPASGAVATAAPTASGGLAVAVREAAATAPKIERVKLRFDAAGGLVKQAVYHDDAAAIPEAVRALAETTFPGHKPTGYETEHYADLGAVFEVELDTADGQRCEVAASAEGKLLYTECQIDPATLPDPVKATVEATAAGAKLLEAERKSIDEREQYTVEAALDGREYYLTIDAAGELISKHLMLPALVELPLD